jgi:hypothetical protein
MLLMSRIEDWPFTAPSKHDDKHFKPVLKKRSLRRKELYDGGLGI